MENFIFCVASKYQDYKDQDLMSLDHCLLTYFALLQTSDSKFTEGIHLEIMKAIENSIRMSR